jgi:hypothetical protein
MVEVWEYHRVILIGLCILLRVYQSILIDHRVVHLLGNKSSNPHQSQQLRYCSEQHYIGGPLLGRIQEHKRVSLASCLLLCYLIATRN